MTALEGRRRRLPAVGLREKDMTLNERSLLLDELRTTLERLASPQREQVEWLSRRAVRPADLLNTSIAAVETGPESLHSELSPVILLRLGALADELNSMSALPDALSEGPDTMLSHSSWTAVRHLARAVLRQPSWPAE